MQVIIWIWLLLLFFPVVWLVYSSFKANSDVMFRPLALPTRWQYENYIKAFTHPAIHLWTYFKNSFFICAISLLILIAVAVLAAYALAKLNFPGKNFIILLLIILMGIGAYSLIIPLYFFIADLGLLNRYFGLILPYVGFSIPFSVIMLHAYFRKFPSELIEAAKIEGCNEIRALFYIVIPISKGAIATIAIVNFIGLWNEFLFSLLMMKNDASRTLPVGIYGFKGTYFTDFEALFPALVSSLIPAVLIFIIFQRNIIEGMTLGAIKE